MWFIRTTPCKSEQNGQTPHGFSSNQWSILPNVASNDISLLIANNFSFFEWDILSWLNLDEISINEFIKFVQSSYMEEVLAEIGILVKDIIFVETLLIWKVILNDKTTKSIYK